MFHLDQNTKMFSVMRNLYTKIDFREVADKTVSQVKTRVPEVTISLELCFVFVFLNQRYTE